MKISLNWLKKYTDFTLTSAQLSEKLTMTGLEVENIYSESAEFKNILIGEVIKIKNHPNADNLKICNVTLGNKEVSVICGADNVKEKQLVPVAVKGSVLADGTNIKKTKIRGVISEGMICSERELGISDNHDGIMTLSREKYKVGEEFSKNFLSDTIFTIDVTPNRPDCLSHIGVAREVSIIADKRLHKPTISLKESNTSVHNSIQINVHDKTACPRYSARVIRNVVIKDSPIWLKNRLKSVGIRSINNVVDITNFILMETGHPLHAFDYDLITGKEINVRKAGANEKFTTLDDIERSLDQNDLLICDGEKGIALAGIMGGCNSEISGKTKNIVLESAYFDPYTIRKTSKKLGLITESSQRFERGADPNNTIYAINRACQLLEELAEGTIERDVVDIYPEKIHPKEIKLRYSRITHLIGQKIPEDSIHKILKGLELRLIDQKGDHIKVKIPTFRPDLKRECDLIEEIVRHYGYNNIQSNMYSRLPLNYIENEFDNTVERIKDFLVGKGLSEIISNTLVSEKHIKFLDNKNVVEIENPLSPETKFLRNSCIPSLLDSVKWNINRSKNTLRLFEIGKKFIYQKETLPVEKVDIVCILTGLKNKIPLWNKNEDNKVSFYQLKGLVESFFEFFKVRNYSFKNYNTPFFDQNFAYSIYIDDKHSGVIGKISFKIMEKWEIKQDVFIFEIDFDNFYQGMDKKPIYSPIPKFPAISRDLSVMIDEKILSGDMKDCILGKGGNFLNQVQIIDVYRGKGIPDGKKSITFNLKFLSTNRTLTEKDVDPIFNKIVKILENKFSATLRA